MNARTAVVCAGIVCALLIFIVLFMAVISVLRVTA